MAATVSLHHTHIIARKEDSSIPKLSSKETEIKPRLEHRHVFIPEPMIAVGNGMKVLIFLNYLLEPEVEGGAASL